MEMSTIEISSDLKQRVECYLTRAQINWEEFLEDTLWQYQPISDESKEAMAEAEDMAKHPEKYPSFATTAELFAHLEALCQEDEMNQGIEY